MSPAPQISAGEPGDGEQATFQYGHGGIPWPLLVLYLAFLVFFTWYVLEYQLPDYLQKGPGQQGGAAVESSE